MSEVKTPWKDYMGDVPMHLDYFQGSMFDAVERMADMYPNSIAFDFMGRSVTYRKMVQEIERCAKSLKTLGVRVGDKVTIAMPNCPQAIYMFYAVNLAQNVTVTGLNHNYQDAEKMIDEQGVSTLPVVIEDDVWVGANSVILPGVTLGRHCVVAAGSVVSHSVPPYSICAGCPARIIKAYDFETKEWKKVEKAPATNHK